MATQTFNVASKTYAAGLNTIGPFVMPQGVSQVVISPTVDSTGVSDPTLSMAYEFDTSADGINWVFQTGSNPGWTGGQLNKQGQPLQPNIQLSGLSSIDGLHCRFLFAPSKSVTMSVSITVS